MSLKNSQRRYGPVSIALHWLMAALLVAVYACIELRSFYPRGSDMREGLKTWHFMLGLTILALVLVRIGWRLANSYPQITPPPPRWQLLVSRALHWVLYLFMLLMPIAGWLILSAEGDAIPFWGLGLPPLTGPSDALAHRVEDIHELVGVIGYWLIGLHVAAALAHHYFLKDDTLRRILPCRTQR